MAEHQRNRLRLLPCAIAVATIALAGCGAKDPSSLHVVNLRVEQPPAGEPPNLLFAIDNRLSTSDSLVSIESPDAAGVSVAGTGGETLAADEPIVLPAHQSSAFEPGDRRVRLERPRRRLEVGDQVQVVFRFGSGLEYSLVAPVVRQGAPGPDPTHG